MAASAVFGASAWSAPALAMDQCPAGTGPSRWISMWFFGSLALSLVLIVLRLTLLRAVAGQPPPRGQELAVPIAVLSPFVGAGLFAFFVVSCPPRTQAPEVVCEHFAKQASESRVPVGFDANACLETWRAEQKRLSAREYRALSSCARRVWLGTMDRGDCADEGFEPGRHAPGTWPTDEQVERWRAQD